MPPFPPAKSAIAPGTATMLCVPRLPAWPAVPTILVVPFLTVAPWPWAVPRPPPFPAVPPVTDVSVVPGTAAPPVPTDPWPRNPAVAASAAPPALPAAAVSPASEPPCWLTALSNWPLLTKPFTPCAASEPVNVCALTERFGAESPPIVRRAPGE